MKMHIEIFSFSNSHAHGVIVLDTKATAPVHIPFSMPYPSFNTAYEHGLLQEIQGRSGLDPDAVLLESTLFLSPNEIPSPSPKS